MLSERYLLAPMALFTEDEIDLIYQAIYRHSNKQQVDTAFDESIKDADEMQHYFRNPVEEYPISPRISSFPR